MMGNMDMMKNMSGQCQMMSDDFSNLESHFEKMMKENDITVLKAEMQKHYAMMQSMHKQMAKHGDMCKSMMSNMGSGDMKSSCAMMGKKSDESGGGHGHDH
jgi:regulator of replication initiation timing